MPHSWLETYAQYCGPQVVASVHGISPRMAADWLVRLDAVTADRQGTHSFGLACALGTRELYLSRWHDRPPHTLQAWPTATQFLAHHDREDDEYVLRSRDHVIHARAGRIVCDTAGTGHLMRVISVLPIRQSWPRCPCAQHESAAAWLAPYTRWQQEIAA